LTKVIGHNIYVTLGLLEENQSMNESNNAPTKSKVLASDKKPISFPANNALQISQIVPHASEIVTHTTNKPSNRKWTVEQFLTEQHQRRMQLLNRLTLIGVIAGVGGIGALLISTIIGGKITFNEDEIVGVCLLGGMFITSILTFVFNRSNNYLWACRILVTGLLLLVSIAFVSFGTAMPLLLVFMLPLALAIVLMENFKDAIIVLVVSVGIITSVYIVQDVMGIYTPITELDAIGITTAGLTITLVILPSIGFLLILPFKNQLQALKLYNQQLLGAYNELQERQHLNQEVIDQLITVVSELRETAQTQSEHSQTQVKEVGDANTMLSQLTASATTIAQFAHQVNEAANENTKTTYAIEQISRKVAQQSEQGLAAVRETVNVSEDVSSMYERLVESLKELEVKNEGSRRILSLLSNFATETHLLALNAAIEAVGAGQYGQRFSVVAHQVKELANRSNKANAEIVAIVGQIADSIQQAVELAGEGYTKATALSRSGRRSGQVIEEMHGLVQDASLEAQLIEESSRQVSGLTDLIKTKTNEQWLGSEGALANLAQLGAISHLNADGSLVVATIAQKLEQLTLKLTTIEQLDVVRQC
jgi:methyl-accepting chemotaxis protein